MGRIKDLLACSLFQRFDAVDLAVVASLTESRQLAGGEALFAEGQVDGNLYIVIQGAIEVSSSLIKKGGGTFQAGRGDVLGSGTLFGQVQHLGEAKVSSQSATVMVLSHENFVRLLAGRRDVAIKLLQALSDDMAQRVRGLATGT